MSTTSRPRSVRSVGSSSDPMPRVTPAKRRRSGRADPDPWGLPEKVPPARLFDDLSPGPTALWRAQANELMTTLKRSGPSQGTIDRTDVMVDRAAVLLLGTTGAPDDQVRLATALGWLGATGTRRARRNHQWDAWWAAEAALDVLLFAVALPPTEPVPVWTYDVDGLFTLPLWCTGTADRVWNATNDVVPPAHAARLTAAIATGWRRATPDPDEASYPERLIAGEAARIILAERCGAAEVFGGLTDWSRCLLMVWERINRSRGQWTSNNAKAHRAAVAVLDRLDLRAAVEHPDPAGAPPRPGRPLRQM